MTAEEYLTQHWIKNPKIHNYDLSKRNHHYYRFNFCANNTVGEKFIDIGCACGDSTYTLKTLKDGHWSGLDFYEPIIQLARKNYPNIPFYYSPDYNYKSLVGEYDTVICSEVLEHIPNDQEFVNALLGIVKQRLIITTPRKNVGDPGHLRLYTTDTLSKLFDGYQIKITTENVFFYLILNK